MMTNQAHPPVSVVIPCHTQQQWPSLVAAVAAVADQSPPPAEIIVVVDHNDALLARARIGLAGVTVLANQRARGASGNRNTGACHATTQLVAFLDGDSYPHPGWLAALAAPLRDPAVVGTGGTITPRWQRQRPRWFPDEFLWTVGASDPALPRTATPVRNVWSASMAVRREAFLAVGGFREGFGKLGDQARPEDTDLCLRMGRHGAWWYAPAAVVEHPVEAERTRPGYFLRRCYQEGRGKVHMSRLLDGWRSLGSERYYLRRTVPRSVLRGLLAGLRTPGAGHAARAAAMVAGVAAAAAGGLVETTVAARQRPVPVALVRAGAGR